MSQPDPLRRRLLAALPSLLLLGAGRPLWAAGRSVTDMAGRTVTLPARIERIASAGGSPAVNAFLFLFGQGGHIITGLPDTFAGPYWKYQRRFAPQIASAPVVSGPPPGWNPDVEALLRLQPDLVCVVSAQAAELVSRAGLTALVLDWQDPDSLPRSVRLLAEVFQMPERAQLWFDWRERLLDRIAAAIIEQRRPRVLYARLRTLTQPIMVPANQLISAAGGRSVTESDNPLGLDSFPFSLEQLLAWDPEVILSALPGEAEQVLADPRFAALSAVRNQRVHTVPRGAHIWTHYTPEQPLGALWLARLLHPQQLQSQDLAREVGDFYQHFYGVKLSTEEVAALLNGGL